MENKKNCMKCGEEKLEIDFHISQFKRNKSICKVCNKLYGKKYREEHKEEEKARNKKYAETHKEEKKENDKIYREINKEEIKLYRKEYYQENKEKLSLKKKENYENETEESKIKRKEYRDNHKEEKKGYDKTYKENNKEKVNLNKREWDKNKKDSDPSYKLRTLVSARISESLKARNSSKRGQSSWDYMPCTKDDMESHIELLFSSPENLVPLDIPWHREDRVWMTWENWKKYNAKTWDDNDPSTWVWNLDHIIPHSTFKYDSLEHPDLKKCWTLSNLRPLSAKQNVIDGSSKIRHKKKEK